MATKLNVHDTPSESIIKAANTEEIITDSTGRKIGVRKLKVLERLNMLKLIGNGNSDNMLYVSQVTPAFLVTSIDGEPIGKPVNELQLNGLLQRLDEHGLEAVINWMAPDDEAPDADPDKEKSQLKK